MPDIDDFERTDLLAGIMAALGIASAVLVIATRALGIAPPERIRRTGPWLYPLGGWLSRSGNWSPPNPRSCPARSSPRHRHCWRCSPTTIRDSATASGHSLQSAGRRLSHRRDARLHRRRRHRLVACRRLLGASGSAPDRPAARHRLAADRFLRLPLQPQRQHVPDRARHRLPGDRADLVRCRRRQQGVLRRGANDGRHRSASWC